MHAQAPPMQSCSRGKDAAARLWLATRRWLAPSLVAAADSALLKQAWMNLWSNMVKYSAPCDDTSFGVFQRLHPQA